MKLHRLIFLSLLICFVFPLMANADQLEDAKTAVKNEDFKKAYELLQPLADQNNLEAQSMLGAMYVNGQGVEKDFTKGLALIMKAAVKGNKDARLKAFMLNMELGKQGDATAMYNVGYMCLNDWAGKHDNDTCLRWFDSSAKLGHEKSVRILAKIYSDGMFGVAPDKEKAVYWENLKKAYAKGIDGKWEGSTSMGPGGRPMKLSYNFKADGDNLTGTYVGFGDKEIEIKDGKIDGNKISFNIKLNFNGNVSHVSYTGLFLGDTLKLSYVSDAGPRNATPVPVSFDAKRVL